MYVCMYVCVDVNIMDEQAKCLGVAAPANRG